MQRLFTKDATGAATNGRWYAGDINALQDAVAAITDLAQTLSLGVLKIGESGLQLLRYGTAEARLTGALRTDGILRGLGGLIAGAFSTTQRDALGTGLAPYGIVILNTTTDRYEWNKGSDGARDWQPLGGAGTVGTLGSRPNANTVVPGAHYFATDQVVEYISDGADWIRTSIPAGTIVECMTDAADTGWILLQGQAWPATTGIYADLYGKWSAKFGSALPDKKGRVSVGVSPGGKTDVDSIGDNDGITNAALRNISHHHHSTQPYYYNDATPSFNAADYTHGGQTLGSTGDTDNQDKPAYLVVNHQAKL